MNGGIDEVFQRDFDLILARYRAYRKGTKEGRKERKMTAIVCRKKANKRSNQTHSCWVNTQGVGVALEH